MTDPLEAAQALVAAARDGTFESEAQWKVLTTVAVNSFERLVKAVEKQHCPYLDEGQTCSERQPVESQCDRCAALAHVAEEIDKAGA